MSEPIRPTAESLSALIDSQINFGLAYIQEARTAYDEGRSEYGDLARQIALNAYSTATRFAARLPKKGQTGVQREMARFKEQVDALLEQRVEVRSIA
jgi:F0F1-type ATP synthase membrane subunit b/b'